MRAANQEKVKDISAEDGLRLLQTDFVFCGAFADIAKKEIESGEPEFAVRVLHRAEEIHAAIARYIAAVDDGDPKLQIEQKLAAVRTRLDTLKGEIEAFSAQS